jgi:hypothetical protein
MLSIYFKPEKDSSLSSQLQDKIEECEFHKKLKNI